MIAPASAYARRGERVRRPARGVIGGSPSSSVFPRSWKLERSCIMPAMATPTGSRDRIQHPATETLDLATIMRTLGDPVRLDVVRLLADGRPRSCGELSSALELPASTGSYHLRLLREAGLTRTRADGTVRHISLRREDLEERFPGLVDVLTQ